MASLRLWDNDLKDVSNDIIKKVLDSLSDKFPSWPPTLGEFKQACLAVQGDSKFKWSHDVVKKSFEKPSTRSSNLDIQRIIDEGAKICKKLKEIYPELDWYQIADKFTSLKKVGRTYYPKLKELQMIEKLSSFNISEIKETILDKIL